MEEKMSIHAGFDLGGTQIKYGLVHGNGEVVFQDKSNTPSEIEELILLLNNLWKKLNKKGKGEIKSVGFGFPGIFNIENQKIFQSPNYAELDNFDLMPALSKFIDKPFSINNDANMAAYGEYIAGAGKDSQSMVLLTLGTGVGSGIILDGKLWQGKCGFAGELGHITVNPNGEKCLCGSQGCLESEVSAKKIVKNFYKRSEIKENISAKDVFIFARGKNQAACRAIEQAGYYLGIALSIIINFINPEKILIGGGIMKSGGLILTNALKEAQKRSYKASLKCCNIKKAGLGNKAGFIGSALWSKQQNQAWY
jgi:glucokinase